MTVTGCKDCPLWAWSGIDPGIGECLHPERAAKGHWPSETPPPTWCPLRTAPLTIAMDGQGVLTSIPVVESKAMPDGTACLVGANGSRVWITGIKG